MSVNLLVSKHRAQEDELSVRDAHLKTVNEVGENLIAQEHFGSDKIRERIDEIGGMMGGLKELTAFRKKRLHEAVDFYQFFADADGMFGGCFMIFRLSFLLLLLVMFVVVVVVCLVVFKYGILHHSVNF